MRRLLASVGALLAACALLVQSGSAAPSLETRLARALDRSGLVPALTGALAIDLERGSVAFEHNVSRSLRPASTEKLAIALAVLAELGPGFRTETSVRADGRLVGRVWKGNLVLKGFGDPELESADLDRLARELRSLGIRRVSGRVLADDSYFDRQRVAPGWKAGYAKVECPPLSALVVDRGVLDGRIADDPALAAAIAFKRALERAGIRVGNASRVGRAGTGARELADVDSPTLRRLVHEMNTESDNFIAEMLTKLLGARELRQGTTAAGVRVVRRELAERGVPLAGVRLVDGSGLSQDDRTTAMALASILTKALREPGIAQPFRASLAVAGRTGTLEDRMERPPAAGAVRAKTGTTAETSALAGYVGTRYVFVLLMNGDPVDTATARLAQDRFVSILARAS